MFNITNDKFVASEKLNSPFEQSHYSGARKFFRVIDTEFPKLKKEKEEAIDEMINDVHGKYKKIKTWLNKTIDKAPSGTDTKRLQQEADDFTEDRFKMIIKLARKDHDNKYGISKHRTSWK